MPVDHFHFHFHFHFQAQPGQPRRGRVLEESRNGGGSVENVGTGPVEGR
jgi:hypothetical protein